MPLSYDVVIVGGAVVGSATAYFLRNEPSFRGSVLVLEKDFSFARCATTRSLASIRHQFSTPQNIAMSMFGTQFLRDAAERLSVGGQSPAIGFREQGYLFLATEVGRGVLQSNHATQKAMGADVVLLDGPALTSRFPWLSVQDLAAGSLGLSGEGWLDAHALMMAFRHKARALGAEMREAEVASLEREGRRIAAVRLVDGTRIACGAVINASGTSAAALARTAGIVLPVEGRKRCVFQFRSPLDCGAAPLVIDPTGVYFRPEAQTYLCGVAPDEPDDPPSDDFEVDWSLWEDRLWPVLAQRVPGFESARVLNAWAGHYDVNTLDHNVILGAHPDVDNLLFANGFSGHGLQQAPAVGRALAELVAHGEMRSLDLTALGWERVLANRPLRELNVV